MLKHGNGRRGWARGTVAPPSEDDGGTWPKHGLGTRCRSALPERELLDRELVDVRVGHADVGALRPGVGDLHREVRARARAGRRRSTAARSPSRGRGRRRTRSGPRPASGVEARPAPPMGPARARRPGRMLSSERWVTFWRKGNCGCVNGRRDPGLLDPDERVARRAPPSSRRAGRRAPAAGRGCPSGARGPRAGCRRGPRTRASAWPG